MLAPIVPLLPSVDSLNERLVVKDNALVMASYTLTIEEQRLILACIEKAQRKKNPLCAEAVEITLTVQEYAQLYGVKMVTAYKALNSASNKLYERSIRMDDAGVRRRVRWLQEQAHYDSGRVKLTFSSLISTHIRQIVTGRSMYRLEQATQLRSQHAIRIFEILHRHLDHSKQEGEWIVSIESLKEILEIDDAYPRWVDLKKRVIVESVNQINKVTSLKVDWSIFSKAGRQMNEIKFTVFETSQLQLGLN
jgi:plasmid replication initiation protein